MANLSAVLCGKKDIRIEDRPIEEPGFGEVKLSLRHVGLCGSDTYMYLHGNHGIETFKKPKVIGHEASAVVVKVGPGVEGLQVDDRVCLEPGNACNQCVNCVNGRHNVCATNTPYSAPFRGYITRYVVMKGIYCHKLPENLSFEEGACIQPLAITVQACRRAGVRAGRTMLILGSGNIGLLCMMTAKAMGVTSICMFDEIEERLDIATELGATTTYLRKSSSIATVVKEVHALIGEVPDLIMECTGDEWCQQLAIMACGPAGTVIYVGIGELNATIPLCRAIQMEIDIKTTWRFDRNCFPIALSFAASGRVNLRRLVSHQFPLAQTNEAMALAASRGPGVLKVLINCRDL